jgi:aminopeptidase N
VLIALLKELLANNSLSPAFVAALLTLPLPEELALELFANDIDPDLLQRIYLTLRQRVSSALRPLLWQTYLAMAPAASPASQTEDAGRRQLKNVCLDLLSGCDQKSLSVAHDQYRHASNATDRVAAISLLARQTNSEAAELIDDFLCWQRHCPAGIELWFSMQAEIALSTTVERVQELTRHPEFSFELPARVRALVGAFASNFVAFNRADGAGYKFVAECAIRVDERNPELAARLLAAFQRWHRLENHRRCLVEDLLTHTSQRRQLSRETSEVLDGLLANSP